MLAEKYYYLCWPTILQWIHTKRPPGSFHFLFFFSLYFNFCFMKQCVQNDFIRIINHKIDEMWIYVVRVCMFLCWSSSWSCVCLFLSYCFVSLLFIFHLCVFFSFVVIAVTVVNVVVVGRKKNWNLSNLQNLRKQNNDRIEIFLESRERSAHNVFLCSWVECPLVRLV